MESGDIADAQIRASSMLDGKNSPGQARLYQKADGRMAGAWSAQKNDVNQWLQVDFGSYTKVSRVATQGKSGLNQWVTKYKIQYSDDGENFWVYKEPGTSLAKVSSFKYSRLSLHLSGKSMKYLPVKLFDCTYYNSVNKRKTMYCIWKAERYISLIIGLFASQNHMPQQLTNRKRNYLAVIVYVFRVIALFKLKFIFYADESTNRNQPSLSSLTPSLTS